MMNYFLNTISKILDQEFSLGDSGQNIINSFDIIKNDINLAEGQFNMYLEIRDNIDDLIDEISEYSYYCDQENKDEVIKALQMLRGIADFCFYN